LASSPYFDNALIEYIEGIISVAEFLIAGYDTFPPQLSRQLSDSIWNATKYINGSTSNEVPYEIVYCLKKALSQWITQECLITTALIDERNYHFYGFDLGAIVNTVFPNKINKKLIQIALPKLYKHRPIYNVGLYHELGHFIDGHYNITGNSRLLNSDPGLTKNSDKQWDKSHRAEYFADLFAASFTGMAIFKFINMFAFGHSASETHPATDDRLAIIGNFLTGSKNKIIDNFNESLQVLKLPELKPQFVKPDISEAFNNTRPYVIQSDGELHGILEAGWDLLENIKNTPTEPWKNLDPFDVDRILNDLIEKSIRNKMIKEKWANANC
jgi:hypothetical protein